MYLHSRVKDNGRTGKFGAGVSFAQGTQTRTSAGGDIMSTTTENSYGMSLYGGASKGGFEYLFGAQFGSRRITAEPVRLVARWL
mgnify:CR=1 FL=1